MFLDKRNRKHCPEWIRHEYHKWFKHRRKGDQEAAANRVGLWSGLVVATISVSFSAIGAWNILEQQSYNFLHQAKLAITDTPEWDDQVVVIAIDEASVESFGRFPWSRDIHADLLETLGVAQPAAITFDILFPDATEQDAQFAQAIAGSDNVVLAVGTDSKGKPLDVTDTIATEAQGFFQRGDVSNPSDDDGISRQIHLQEDHDIPSLGVATLEVYAEALSNTAQAEPSEEAILPPRPRIRKPHSPSALPENRGQITEAPEALSTTLSGDSYNGKSYNEKSSSTVGIPAAFSRPTSSRPNSPRPNSSRPIGDRTDDHTGEQAGVRSHHNSHSNTQNTAPNIPDSFASPLPPIESSDLNSGSLLDPFIPDNETIWLNWPGEIPATHEAEGTGELQIYSYIDVLKGRVDSNQFQNKIVLVGSTLTGDDPLRTPFQKDPPVSGVYLYAATINNLLNQSFLRRPPRWQTTLLLITLALGSSRLLRRQGVYRRLAVVIGFPIIWSSLALGGFMAGWWLPVAAPIGTIVFSAIAIQLHEQQEKQQLMALFSMNVSPGTAELIWRHKGEILDQGELAAQKLTATVLFMDIRGFTGIAESLPSQKLLPWLNQYFETMTDCIMNHDGMVDKYIGDAIMAVFGAPVPRTDPQEIKADAIAAVKASIEMHERLAALNQELVKQNLPVINFGIGIHTGPLIGGTVGNRSRLNYSLFGDTVNIAARLESMTKTLPEETPFKMLLSADTYDYAGANLPVKLFRSTRLRGRTGNTDIYTVNGKMEPPRRRKTDWIEPVSHPQLVPQTTQQPVDAVAKAS